MWNRLKPVVCCPLVANVVHLRSERFIKCDLNLSQAHFEYTEEMYKRIISITNEAKRKGQTVRK